MATARLGGVTITNADKVWWPDDGITKLDVATHYARMGGRLLPWTIDRPLTVERCPDGLRGRCFYRQALPSAGAARAVKRPATRRGTSAA